MSTTPNVPTATTVAGSILSVLTASNGYVTLGIQLAGVFVPLVKGLIQKIEGIGAGNTTVTFSALVTADDAEIASIVQSADTDLAAINAELVRLGAPPLPVVAPAPALPATAQVKASFVTVNNKPI